jgi:type III pantothenate kinase
VILLVDVGNTRVKWALGQGGELTDAGVAEHLADGLAATLESAWARLRKPLRIVACNVAGETAAGILTGWALGRWGVTPEFIGATESACGLRNGYSEPARLGADRWAAMVGAWSLRGGPLCVVDCGTAVTVDVVSAEGEHLGGLILPGLVLMRRALTEGTAGVRTAGASDPGAPTGPPIGEADVALLARTTAGAVAGGTLYALVATLDRVVADLAPEVGGGDLRRIITGGDAPVVLPLLAGQWAHRPDLVLWGLRALGAEHGEPPP